MEDIKVALCAIGRLENRYAVEFIEYYKQLGFDNIFVLDNNKDGEEYFQDVLQPYIDEGFVIVKDFRNRCEFKSQVHIYTEMYYELSSQFDWIAYFDFDEFLYLEHDKDIKSYLNRPEFLCFNQILVNWKIYTDNNLIYDDGRTCLERFTTPMETNKCVEYLYHAENKHVKPIIRTRLPEIFIDIPHNFIDGTPPANFKQTVLFETTCNASGEQCRNHFMIDINYEKAYLKHFTTKTIDEFLTNKYAKGVGDRDINMFYATYPIERFFKYNELTPEKMDYLKEKGININIDKIQNWWFNWEKDN